jgi:hypothetical protein
MDGIGTGNLPMLENITAPLGKCQVSKTHIGSRSLNPGVPR